MHSQVKLNYKAIRAKEEEAAAATVPLPADPSPCLWPEGSQIEGDTCMNLLIKSLAEQPLNAIGLRSFSLSIRYV